MVQLARDVLAFASITSFVSVFCVAAHLIR